MIKHSERYDFKNVRCCYQQMHEEIEQKNEKNTCNLVFNEISPCDVVAFDDDETNGNKIEKVNAKYRLF